MSKALPLAVALGLIWTASLSVAQAPDLQSMDLILRSVPDGPIAKINGKNVSKEEYIDLYQTELLGVASQMGSANINDRVRVETAIHSMHTLVEREILYQEAIKRKITVPDKEVDDGWKETLQKLHETAAQNGDKDISDEALLKKTGKTLEEGKAGLRKLMVTRKMREQVLAEQKVTVSDEEVKNFYEKNKEQFKQPEAVHLQQIFISARKGPRDPVDPAKKEQARQKIEQALKRVQAGESFEAVAKAVSEAPDKENGGDMGMIPVSKLPPFYAKAAGAMHPGDVSGIVESEYGFHFVKLLEATAAGNADLEKATPFIRSVLTSQRGDKAVREFCKPILNTPGSVEVYLQLEKTLAAHPELSDILKTANQPDGDGQETKKPAPGDKPTASAPATESKPKTSNAKKTTKKAVKK